MGQKLKIGLLGGSFNPPHMAHLLLSKVAIKTLRLDKLLWIVVPLNPFKKKSTVLPQKVRILLSNILLKNSKKISAIDFESSLPSFETYYTIKKVKHKFLDKKLYFIMGSDNILQFHKWKNFDYIVNNTNVTIFTRNGFHKAMRAKSIIKHKNKIRVLYSYKKDISSTAIRRNLGIFWKAKLLFKYFYWHYTNKTINTIRK